MLVLGRFTQYTACLGLCDVHVSKGRLPPAPGLLFIVVIHSIRISLDRVPSTICACCILHNKALDFAAGF